MMEPFGSFAPPAWRQRLICLAQSMPVSWAGRRLALVLRKIALFGAADIFDLRIEGLNWRLRMKDNVSERKFAFMPQFFDPFERWLLRQRLKPGDVFVDVGANAGVYSLIGAASVGAAGRVLAIEPNISVLSRLRENATLNGFEKIIAVENAGVSGREGVFDLTIDAQNLGGSSLVEARGGQVISVPCFPLLSLLQKRGIEKIDAMKLDIEGAEDIALMPFLAAAPKALYPRLLILENSPACWRGDLPAALKGAGFALVKTTRMNQVWELKSSAAA